MNLIEESFQNREQKKKRRTTRIVLIAIILVFIIIVAIMAYLMYLQSTVMKLTLDGQANEKIKSLLIFENDGTIYVPIKEIAQYFGYDSFNGEYSEKSEQPSKCYVQSENEVANFELGENKIYKLDLTKKDADYEYVYIKNPVKAYGGVLYASTEGIEKAFNISFEYDVDKNTITILTMPYLYQYYASKVLDYGYIELDSTLANQKAILRNQLVVLKDKNKKQYGVIGVDGSAILEPKYDSITYLPNTDDFLVETNKKVGILSSKGETKVQIMYDSIQLMDSDSGLYVVQKDKKFGAIDIRGNVKIYIENDQIGMDISKFAQNNIKNKYILADGLIPVRKDKYWGLYDTNGNQVTQYQYDSFGYIASSNKDAINLLVIPNFDLLVACKDKKYTLVNSAGIELFAAIADDIYMTIDGGEKHYYIIANDQQIDAEEWLNANNYTKAGTTNQDRNNNNNNGEEQTQDNQNNNQNEEEEGNSNNNEEEQNQEQNQEQQQNGEENQEENRQENQEDNQEENQEE